MLCIIDNILLVCIDKNKIKLNLLKERNKEKTKANNFLKQS